MKVTNELLATILIGVFVGLIDNIATLMIAEKIKH